MCLKGSVYCRDPEVNAKIWTAYEYRPKDSCQSGIRRGGHSRNQGQGTNANQVTINTTLTPLRSLHHSTTIHKLQPLQLLLFLIHTTTSIMMHWICSLAMTMNLMINCMAIMFPQQIKLNLPCHLSCSHSYLHIVLP